MSYKIEKTENNIDIEAVDQEGKKTKEKGTRYTIKVEGTEKRLVIEGIGKISQEQIETIMDQAIKSMNASPSDKMIKGGDERTK